MKHTIIRKTALKAKSEELGIPFSNLLAGYVLEQFLYLLADSPFSLFLWLKNSNILGVEQYRKKNILTLDFVYKTDQNAMKKDGIVPGQKLDLKMGYVMLSYILKEEKIPEIKWKGRASVKDDRVELLVTGEFEEMTVPIQIRVRELSGESMSPVRTSFPLFMETNKRIPFLGYPSENTLVENLFSIIQNMELIPEMSAYDIVYQILKNTALDGRHVRDLLFDLGEREQMALDERRADEILSYKKYTYMRKRWEKYLRHDKRKEPSWDEVMDQLSGFLPYVWKSICRDEVFFGDWMPELGRFLD